MDARAEVAAALYAASATQATAARVADAKIRAQRAEIERMRAQLRLGAAGAAELRAALTAAEEAYVNALAARDRVYAEEIGIFRAAIQDIAATAGGAAALARFNAGDEVSALAILDDLRTARDRARKTRSDVESAAEGPPEAFILDPDQLARFKREAQVLASLNHPNIAAIYGFEESDGVRALVLELVEGSTLADRIAKGRTRSMRPCRSRGKLPRRSKRPTNRGSSTAI